MKGLAILILIVLFFWIVGPFIMKWAKRKAMERAEDYMRQSMGLPPRHKKKSKFSKQQRQQEKQQYYQRERRNPFGPDAYGKEPLIPKEYAEDVEFTETIDYSAHEIKIEKEGDKKIYHESQISDVEWTEIKQPRSK